MSETNNSKPASDIESRLFNLRMKINQGRKSNKTEVEEEYKRFTDPKYELKQKLKGKAVIGQEDKDDDQKKWNVDELIMQQTAEGAEYEMSKKKKKEEAMATFGWKAFTTEASHRAYEKKIKKLPVNESLTEQDIDLNPIDYGKTGTNVSKAALDRLSKDVIDREANKAKFSKRRMNIDSVDVDNINEKNAIFNKKLKRNYDKYTVEIRQNLERGTAI